eukprot:scaffold3007_cov157-Amphora_coffeaeformis.AAC.2
MDASTYVQDTPSSSSTTTMLEHLSFDQSISRVFSIYRRGFVAFTSLGFGLLLMPILVAAFVVQPKLLSWYNIDQQAYETDPNYILEHVGDMMKIAVLKTLVVIPFAWFFELSSIHVVGSIYMDKTPSTIESIKATFRLAPAYIAAAILATMVVYLGYGAY